LLHFVRIGVVRCETLIRKDDSQWTPARGINGLFEAARRPRLVFHCSLCGGEIDRPPIVCPSCGREILEAPSRVIEYRLPDDLEMESTEESIDAHANAWSQWLNRLKHS
jgi:hypothetical protein